MKKNLLVPMVVVVVAVGGWFCYEFGRALIEKSALGRSPIRLGVLHSLSGTMAISEKPVVDATLLAIEEINRSGGVSGRRIEAVVADGRSDWPTFAREARRLICEEEVSVVFGCWTSASRKTVKPIFEEHDHLLFYPVQYEGLEQSPNIVYTGAVTNQQIIPAVRWCFDHLGKRFFLVGSDYVFPRTAGAIIGDQVTALGGEIVAEEYVVLGGRDFGDVVQKIVKAQPDVILNTVNGDSNIALFGELRRAGITPEKIPVMSFSIAEEELRMLDVEQMVGDYACWNYFQSVDTEENRAFVKRFRDEYGPDRVITDPMEAGYFGVYLWAQAVEEAGTDEVGEVAKAIKNQAFSAPEGLVCIDFEDNHTSKIVRIGKIRPDGQFDVVWSSQAPVHPTPFPVSRSRSQWNRFLDRLYVAWGGHWSHPGESADHIDMELAGHVASIEELAGDPVLLAAVQASHEKSRSLAPEQIEQLDEAWQTSGGDDALSKELLTNAAARRLAQLQEDTPQLKEIFVTDAAGLVVAMTNRTSDYFQADERWWIEAYNQGEGQFFHQAMQYDKSAEDWGIPLSVPVYDQRHNAIGVIKAFVGASELLSGPDE